MIVPFIEDALGWLTLLSQIFLAVLLILYIAKRAGNKRAKQLHGKIWRKLEKRALTIAFIVVLVAMCGSLFFEEVAGYEPCELCWWQRIFMYPQVFLFAMALLGKNKDVFKNALVLSVIGGAISLYHWTLHMRKLAEPGFSDACSATGISCASTEVLYFGYITIPLMAFTAFALVIVLFLASRTAAIRRGEA